MNKVAVLSALVISGLVWGIGCSESGSPAEGGWRAVRGAPAVEEVAGLRSDLLPAWQTQRELDRGRNRPDLRVNNSTRPPLGEVYVPAEYASMEGMLIHLPVSGGDGTYYYQQMASFYAGMIKGAVAAGARPYILVAESWEQQGVENRIRPVAGVSAQDVSFVYTTNDSLWTRDYGPWHVYVDGQRAIVDQQYYSGRPEDDQIPKVLGRVWDEDVYSTSLYTEGGNFMTDGLGTCWMSYGVLWNNSLSREAIESIYRDYLGCKHIEFIDPLPGEGTTHIDMFSKILNQDTILVAFSSTTYGASQEEIDFLDRAAEAYRSTPKPDLGQWNIVRIPMTFHNVRYSDGSVERVFNAHTNSLAVNNSILVPVYGRVSDSQALAVYRKEMPGYSVIGVESRVIIPWGGSVHCSTMQIPVRKLSSCGDGVVTSPEPCEPMYLRGQTCDALGYAGGTLRCTSTCALDKSACF